MLFLVYQQAELGWRSISGVVFPIRLRRGLGVEYGIRKTLTAWSRLMFPLLERPPVTLLGFGKLQSAGLESFKEPIYQPLKPKEPKPQAVKGMDEGGVVELADAAAAEKFEHRPSTSRNTARARGEAGLNEMRRHLHQERYLAAHEQRRRARSGQENRSEQGIKDIRAHSSNLANSPILMFSPNVPIAVLIRSRTLRSGSRM